MSDTALPPYVQSILESLASDHDDLGSRIRTVAHTVSLSDPKVRIHAHFIALREGKPTVDEFVSILNTKLVGFCLSRARIKAAQSQWSSMPNDKIVESAVRLHENAVDLFKRANKATNRNGEFGEVIAYLLIERVLRAPQFVAKMSLKTSPQMPVHGSDGIHFKRSDSGELILYWGESKCYSSINSALDQACLSVADALKHTKMKHELFLIEEHADWGIFDEKTKGAVLTFLDPYSENYNKRIDASVVLIVFDFEKFAAVEGVLAEEAESKFAEHLKVALPAYATTLAAGLSKHQISNHQLEVFFLPVPSVSDLRQRFQQKIGWQQ